MKILVYEFITGGGTWSTAGKLSPEGSLLQEGAAMLDAITADFAQLDGVQLVSLRDSRLRGNVGLKLPQVQQIFEISSADQELTALLEIGTRVDAVLVIAPELDGYLLERCRLLETAGARLISPSASIVDLCSDKHRTAEYLRTKGVPTPPGWLAKARLTRVDDLEPKIFPLIAKPNDGCGSINVQRIHDPSELARVIAAADSDMRVEKYCLGTAVSVAVLCGPAGNCALPAASQRLASKNEFTYLGGSLPLGEDAQRRAQALALKAAAGLESPRGYLGIDIVLGIAEDGSEDFVIEINPRLTTSYVGLRQLANVNLAAAMLAISQGEEYALSFMAERIEFNADGTFSKL